MKNHQDIKANVQDADSLHICLNSFAEVGDIDDDELANYIVYIDEVSLLLEFTHNDYLDGVLKVVFTYLQRLVKFAGTSIIPYARINDATFLFIKSIHKTTLLCSQIHFRNSKAFQL